MNHLGTKMLETDRLLLRRFTIDDAEAVFNNWASDSDVTKYLTWSAHQNVTASLKFMHYCEEKYTEPTTYQWGIELKTTHELIGNISVVKCIEELESFELGWVIGKKYWGHGYTVEAALKLCEFLFENVGANCIYAEHDVNNRNSGRVMQKIGMKFEGILRQSGRNNQGIVDCARYSILKEEWFQVIGRLKN